MEFLVPTCYHDLLALEYPNTIYFHYDIHKTPTYNAHLFSLSQARPFGN